jgi:Flp pilus assembly protein TadG
MLTRHLAKRRAAAAAEFAVLTPVLALLLVGATDFARAFYYYVTVANCARNGALYGCLSTANSNNASAIQTAALTDASGLSPQPSISSKTGTDANSNPYVSVTASYSFSTLVSYPRLPNTMTLSRTVQMRVAQGQPN